jgi:hypothetical protein
MLLERARRLSTKLLALGAVIGPGIARADPAVFLIEGRPPQAAIAAAPWANPPAEPESVPASPMLRVLAGVLATLDARDLAVFRRAADTRTRVPPDIDPGVAIASLYMHNRLGSARVDIARVEHGWLLASLVPPDGGANGPIVRARLNEPAIADRLATWETPRPDPSAPATFAGAPRAMVVELEAPLVAAPIRLDDATAAERFARGRRNPFDTPLTRDLEGERLYARLPAGFEPSRPTGLLVWISPTPEGRPPPHLFEAADALNLVCVSAADAGNDRTPLDRIQLTLDAVATVSARVWIDHERVYAAGMSGGGRIASMLWACFPDVFTGAAAIVGMNSHHPIPTGKSNQYWPPSHELPTGDRGRALRINRLAAISGPRDYNFREMQARTTRLQRERLAVRLFDHADLGHTMPTPEQLTRALTWVDAAHADRRAENVEQARLILDRHLAEHGRVPPPNEDAARRLERVTVLAPWTDPAWTAAELLGYADPITTGAAPPDPGPPPPE